MLAAFLDIKPKPQTDHHAPKPPKPPTKTSATFKTSKTSKTPKTTKTKKRDNVEPYESGMHAQFKPSPRELEPCGLAGAYSAECEGVPLVEDACDPYETYESYEYLLQDEAGAADDNDSESCMTFDDTCSDITDTLGTSPADGPAFDTVLLSKRRMTASEVPVYTGPELWFEDDDFIE